MEVLKMVAILINGVLVHVAGWASSDGAPSKRQSCESTRCLYLTDLMVYVESATCSNVCLKRKQHHAHLARHPQLQLACCDLQFADDG